MARKKKYTLDEVLKSLQRKHDCKVDAAKKTVYTLNGKNPKHSKTNDLGNRSWGKIDFLVNFNSYTHYSVSEF